MAYRNTVFVGNCQAYGMWRVYKDYFADSAAEKVIFIDPISRIDGAARKALEEADAVVIQELDSPGKIETNQLHASTKIFRFPVVMIGFLWPFSGRPHPRNREYGFLAHGPFPVSLGDTFLNRLILAGVDADAAVERYMSLDVNKVTNLDRLYQIAIERQRQRDAKTGMSIADTIEHYLREESLFQDFGHPRPRIFRLLARQLYTSMGISESQVDRALAALVKFPFPATALPIHPAVARHFGLAYSDERTTYPFHHEGPITFEDYVRRYMRYDWNEELQEGIWLSYGADSRQALALIDAGLNRSPNSSMGHRVKSMILLRLGKLMEAHAAARMAVDLDPDEPDNVLILAQTHAALGSQTMALSRAKMVTESFPGYAPAYRTLASLQLRAGQFDHAVRSGRRALEVLPGDPSVSYVPLPGDQFDHLLLTGTDLSQAEKLLNRIVELSPRSGLARRALAEAIGRQGRVEEAIQHALQAVALAPSNHDVLNMLNRYLWRFVTHKDAQGESMIRAAIDLAPQFAGFHRLLAKIFVCQTRYSEAEKSYRRVIELDPGYAVDHVQLSFQLARLGQLSAAEDAARRAIALSPSLPSAHFALSDVLGRLGRFDAGAESARQCVVLQPRNAHAQFQLGNQELRRGDVEAARRAFAKAAELEPTHAIFQRAFADALYRAGDVENGIKEMRRAVALDPADALTAKQLDALLSLEAKRTDTEIESSGARLSKQTCDNCYPGRAAGSPVLENQA